MSGIQIPGQIQRVHGPGGPCAHKKGLKAPVTWGQTGAIIKKFFQKNRVAAIF